MGKKARRCFALPLPESLAQQGTFVPPTMLEISSIAVLPREVFGPVLHVVRYRRDQLDQVLEAIEATGYGLTLGVHSRIDATVDTIIRRSRVGNVYVNRTIIGAVVGVQPFGGEGKSGTGPKAGGPLYLKRLQHGATFEAPQAPPNTDAALAALLGWSLAQGHTTLALRIDDYQATSLNGVDLELPGPTGERNRLGFRPRGLVLCQAGAPDALLNQLAAVLATGNEAVVTQGACPEILSSLPAAVRDRVRSIDATDAGALPLALALLDEAAQQAWRPRLAAREGALVGIVPTSGLAPIPLWRLVAERAVCINTTAAGGNASLMTLGL
jgi:RHH-type proline utilization regulon transcriptional repressor/proline dehydrogenase/delta 1-pyrroline-5-carboxylate dehydrogenase